MSIFGSKIKEYRIKNKLDQKVMAKLIGLSSPTLYRIENGTLGLTEKNFLKILGFFNAEMLKTLKNESLESEINVDHLIKTDKSIKLVHNPEKGCTYLHVNRSKNGFTEGTYGLKKYGVGFKKISDFRKWAKQNNIKIRSN